jgi:hypothetical protein
MLDDSSFPIGKPLQAESGLSPNQTNVPEIFWRHTGTWQGEYIKTDTEGNFLRRFSGQFTVSITGTTYRQVNRYQYPDGSQLQSQLLAQPTAKSTAINTQMAVSFSLVLPVSLSTAFCT